MPGGVSDHDAIVLGAGISGLVSASILAEGGRRDVVVVDEFDEVGGNHTDCRIGPYTFDIGSFIFQDDSPLLQHFPQLLDLYVPIDPTWGKINPQGQVTQYPMSLRDDLIRAGPIEWVRIATSLLKARLFQREIADAKDFASFWVGGYFYKRSGLENYMERFFGIPSREIDLEFATKRMLWIKEYANVPKILRMLTPTKSPPATNRQLARPREGYAWLYAPAVSGLRDKGVSFEMSARPVSIRRDGCLLTLDLGTRQLRAPRVVSTIPIDRARALCRMEESVSLPSVTLISLFYSFAGRKGFDCSVLYNFTYGGMWKRLTVFSDFYGQVDGRDYFAVEVVASRTVQSADAADRDFRASMQANGLVVGDLVLEGSRIVPYAYPVYTGNATERAASALKELHAFGLESFGRQGGFDYQPTARVSTLQAETMLKAPDPSQR